MHSDPHEECSGDSGGLGSSDDWNRYNFIPAYAFMHYGECKYDTDPGQAINGGNQLYIGTGHSVDTCAAACKTGGIWDLIWQKGGLKRHESFFSFYFFGLLPMVKAIAYYC